MMKRVENQPTLFQKLGQTEKVKSMERKYEEVLKRQGRTLMLFQSFRSNLEIPFELLLTSINPFNVKIVYLMI